MTHTSICPECRNSNLYASEGVSAGGGYAPNYLPGLGNFLSAAKFKVVVCKDCGLTRFFASQEVLGKLSESRKWHKV
jgi:predicted nucleic-acid-binding Zn-ribbon protein